jgi:DNA-binding CsgD family transcriptional regulator
MLRVEVLEALRIALPFDFYVFVLTDPLTCVGAAPLAAVPRLDDLPQLIRLKYLTALNRWTALPRGRVATLEQESRGRRSLSLVWSELLAGYGVRDVASCAFMDRYGCWGFLDLWRLDQAGGFSAAEIALLQEMVPVVTGALRRGVAASFGSVDPSAPQHQGAVVLLLGPTLDVRAQTPATQEYLARLLPPAEGRPPVPAAAYNTAAQLLAVEAGVDSHQPASRVPLGGGQWLTFRAARIGEPGRTAESDIAVTIEHSSPSDRLGVFCSAFTLTPRETELVGQLATGRSARAIGDELFISEYTVRDHLKSVFTKTGTSSRAELLSAALGTGQ